MKSEQVVKRVYPKAWSFSHRGAASLTLYWTIRNEGLVIGSAAHRESWAWADARRRIQSSEVKV